MRHLPGLRPFLSSSARAPSELDKAYASFRTALLKSKTIVSGEFCGGARDGLGVLDFLVHVVCSLRLSAAAMLLHSDVAPSVGNLGRILTSFFPKSDWRLNWLHFHFMHRPGRATGLPPPYFVAVPGTRDSFRSRSPASFGAIPQRSPHDVRGHA